MTSPICSVYQSIPSSTTKPLTLMNATCVQTSVDVRNWAAFYLSKGWQVVPLMPGTKKCVEDEWQKLKFKVEDFKPDDNIGLKSSDGMVVIDEDCSEAVACADLFLPSTGAIYGRSSRPKSKRLYRSSFEKTVAFKDLEAGSMLVELRANHQDMAPPSKHPEGEVLAWDGEIGEAGTVEPQLLLRAVRLLATCSLVSRYYNPPGNRHEWCLALAGVLRQLGLTEDETQVVVEGAALWARDAKLRDRQLEVRSTYLRSDDEPLLGSRALADVMDTGKSFLKSLYKIWGSSGSEFETDPKTRKILRDSQKNIRKALAVLNVSLAFDQFAQRPLATYQAYTGLLQDGIVNRIRLDLEMRCGFLPQKDHFFDVIRDETERNPFHPVLDYLCAQRWDSEPRLDDWLIRSAKAGATPYVRAVSALVLKAAVARVLSPGCKFDEMLVLESGTQGLQKSSALRMLCPDPKWFSDDLPLNVDSKQVVERTLGKWIVEASDLSGMSPSKVEHLKAMLSRQVDGPVRMAYARLPIEQPRQFVIVGTTNSYSYLTDMTGNRRFWPVRVETFDLDWIRANRDQLWAEAHARVLAGESIRLAPELYAQAELQQERRTAGDPWEAIVADAYLDHYQRITTQQIWTVLAIPVERRDARGNNRIGKVMQRLGFRKMTVIGEGARREWGFGRGKKLVDDGTDE
jgi:hypothetical protein